MIIQDGQLVYEAPSLQQIQKMVKENLKLLWDEYKRPLNPEEYPVDLSQECWNHKMNKIHEVKEEMNKRLNIQGE